MSSEATRAAVTAWYRHLERGEIEQLRSLYAREFTWTVMGNSLPTRGTYPLDEWETKLQSYVARMRTDPRPVVTLVAMTVEGMRAAVEAESLALTHDGRKYAQQYHMLFEVADGRIRSIREYQDTKLFFDLVLCDECDPARREGDRP